MRLESWQALLIFPVIVLLWSFWSARAKPARVVWSIPVPSTLRARDPAKILLVVRMLALGLLVLALARPQDSHTTQERKVSGIDIVMVMDVSASMLAEDMADRSRLDIAKQTMEKFIKGRMNDRIGFVIFSGEPLTLAPPTLDYSLVIRAIRDIETGVLKDGTGIGDGLSLAVNRLRNSDAKSRIVVLLTDGDNNVGQIGPADAGELALGYGIKVYTIAIGREGRIRIPIRQKTPLGTAITQYIFQENALNPELLQLIAKQTGGQFYRVQDLETMESVFEEIDRLEKTEIKTQEKVHWKERFDFPVKLALFLLVLEQLLARFWWRPAT